MDPEKAAQENKGLSLLKAGRKGVLSIVFSRTAIIVLLLALHALERDDIMMMPKGDKLVKLLRLK